MKSAALVISVILNFGLAYMLFAQAMDGCAEDPNGRVGVLIQDVEVGVFDTDETLFTLPKGLVVREASASGAGWFEPYRFRIVVTANNERFVDYEPSDEDLAVQSAEYYSAEVSKVRP
jgi:hypothetical protein